MNPDLLHDPTRMSGGEVEGPLKAAYDAIRKLITAEPDVHRLLAVLPFHDSVPTGRWLYFIETPFSSFPRFVIGETDLPNAEPSILFQSSTEWSARDHWDTPLSPTSDETEAQADSRPAQARPRRGHLLGRRDRGRHRRPREEEPFRPFRPRNPLVCRPVQGAARGAPPPQGRGHLVHLQTRKSPPLMPLPIPPEAIPFFLCCCGACLLGGMLISGLGWGLYWTILERRERAASGVVETLTSPRPRP